MDRRGRTSYDERMRPTAERVASNEALFAEANEAIAVLAGSLEPRPTVPFLCECPDPRCLELAEASLGEYALVRLSPNQFLIAPDCRGGDLAGTRIVEQTERYMVVDRLLAT